MKDKRTQLKGFSHYTSRGFYPLTSAATCGECVHFDVQMAADVSTKGKVFTMTLQRLCLWLWGIHKLLLQSVTQESSFMSWDIYCLLLYTLALSAECKDGFMTIILGCFSLSSCRKNAVYLQFENEFLTVLATPNSCSKIYITEAKEQMHHKLHMLWYWMSESISAVTEVNELMTICFW